MVLQNGEYFSHTLPKINVMPHSLNKNQWYIDWDENKCVCAYTNTYVYI